MIVKKSVENEISFLDEERVLRLHENNTKVIEDFIVVQKEELKLLNSLIGERNLEKEDNDGLLSHVKKIQEKSLEILEKYFCSQAKIIDMVQKEYVVFKKENIRDDSNKKIINTINTLKNEIKEKVVQIVSERTGFEKEIINENMELEGELGIDSLGRIEIFTGIKEELKGVFPNGECNDLEYEELENTKRISTIDDIIMAITDFLCREDIIVLPKAVSKQFLEPMEEE